MNRPAAIIEPGATVQYRKVGRGTVTAHTCSGIRYDCSQHHGGGGQHRYAVQFLTGAYRGTTRDVWVKESDIIEPAPAAGPLAGLVAAFDAEAARMRATMGDQRPLFGAEVVVGLGQLPGQLSLFAGGE